MHCARLSCRSRKPSASTARLLPTGRSSQAETSLPHSFISHYLWADSGRAQRYGDTRQRHERPGTPSSPPYRRPLELRTLTPCSPPHPSYEANSTNYKSCCQNKWTHPHSFSNHWVRPSENTGQKKVLVNTTQQVSHQQLITNLSANNIQKAILISRTAKKHGSTPTTTRSG